jgi:hypothetical protein
MIPSAVGAAPLAYVMKHPKERLNVSNSAPSATQPDSHMIGRGTNSSNKINATESTNPLIWTVPEGRLIQDLHAEDKLWNKGHGYSRAALCLGCWGL